MIDVTTSYGWFTGSTANLDVLMFETSNLDKKTIIHFAQNIISTGTSDITKD